MQAGPRTLSTSGSLPVRTMLLCLAAVALAACGPATGTASGSPPAAASSPAAAAASSPPAAAASSPAAAGGPCGRVAAPPEYRHVVWIWMENHSYGDIIGDKA